MKKIFYAVIFEDGATMVVESDKLKADIDVAREFHTKSELEIGNWVYGKWPVDNKFYPCCIKEVNDENFKVEKKKSIEWNSEVSNYYQKLVSEGKWTQERVKRYFPEASAKKKGRQLIDEEKIESPSKKYKEDALILCNFFLFSFFTPLP
jgi:hypothetical protein